MIRTLLVFLVAGAIPVLAQYTYTPTVKETENFFSKHVPEAIPLYAKIMEEEGRKAYRKAMQEAALEVADYFDARGQDKALAANLLGQIRTGYQIDALLLKYHAEKKAEARGKIRNEILQKTKNLAALEQTSLEMELESMQAIVKEIEFELEQSRSMNASNFAEHVDALLLGRPVPGSVDPRAAAIKKNLPAGWHTDLASARSEAKQTGKPVLLLVAAAWCKPCRDMAKDVLPDPGVVRSVKQRVIPVYLESDEHLKLLSTHGVSSVPTLLLLDKRDAATARKVGLISPEALVKWLTKTVRPPQ